MYSLGMLVSLDPPAHVMKAFPSMPLRRAKSVNRELSGGSNFEAAVLLAGMLRFLSFFGNVI